MKNHLVFCKVFFCYCIFVIEIIRSYILHLFKMSLIVISTRVVNFNVNMTFY